MTERQFYGFLAFVTGGSAGPLFVMGMGGTGAWQVFGVVLVACAVGGLAIVIEGMVR